MCTTIGSIGAPNNFVETACMRTTKSFKESGPGADVRYFRIVTWKSLKLIRIFEILGILLYNPSEIIFEEELSWLTKSASAQMDGGV
jgi:hypothetical protein